MKVVIALLAALLLMVPAAYAGGFELDCEKKIHASLFNACVEHPGADVYEDNTESFDYGVYVHLILWESPNGNFTIGNWNTWEIQRGEITSLLGATIYLNRLTYQKR